ncbi:hypothetical protein B0H11DRAFT_246641 [Mycena galericulata]|nr:hypothetical protein B0H11DRAFT_246641 [Mycena galericulata]
MYLASPRCYTFIRSTNFITLFLNLVFLVSYLSHIHSDCTFLHIALCTSGSYKYYFFTGNRVYHLVGRKLAFNYFSPHT